MDSSIFISWKFGHQMEWNINVKGTDNSEQHCQTMSTVGESNSSCCILTTYLVFRKSWFHPDSAKFDRGINRLASGVIYQLAKSFSSNSSHTWELRSSWLVLYTQIIWNCFLCSSNVIHTWKRKVMLRFIIPHKCSLGALIQYIIPRFLLLYE